MPLSAIFAITPRHSLWLRAVLSFASASPGARLLRRFQNFASSLRAIRHAAIDYYFQ